MRLSLTKDGSKRTQNRPDPTTSDQTSTKNQVTLSDLQDGYFNECCKKSSSKKSWNELFLFSSHHFSSVLFPALLFSSLLFSALFCLFCLLGSSAAFLFSAMEAAISRPQWHREQQFRGLSGSGGSSSEAPAAPGAAISSPAAPGAATLRPQRLRGQQFRGLNGSGSSSS